MLEGRAREPVASGQRDSVVQLTNVGRGAPRRRFGIRFADLTEGFVIDVSEVKIENKNQLQSAGPRCGRPTLAVFRRAAGGPACGLLVLREAVLYYGFFVEGRGNS